jgi:large repetitive protein
MKVQHWVASSSLVSRLHSPPLPWAAVSPPSSLSLVAVAFWRGCRSRPFVVSLVDAHNVPGATAYTLTVNPPNVKLLPSRLASATVGVLYSVTIVASGGTAPYVYDVSSGTLPTGLSLNPATGVLSGTPGTAGTYSFVVSVADSSTGTGPYTTSHAYTLKVRAKLPRPGSLDRIRG